MNKNFKIAIGCAIGSVILAVISLVPNLIRILAG